MSSGIPRAIIGSFEKKKDFLQNIKLHVEKKSNLPMIKIGRTEMYPGTVIRVNEIMFNGLILLCAI